MRQLGLIAFLLGMIFTSYGQTNISVQSVYTYYVGNDKVSFLQDGQASLIFKTTAYSSSILLESAASLELEPIQNPTNNFTYTLLIDGNTSTILVENTSSSSSGAPSQPNAPSLWEGMLYFDDLTHYEDYFEYLENAIDFLEENTIDPNPDPEDSNEDLYVLTEEDIVLENFESDYSEYVSFRKYLLGIYDYRVEGLTDNELAQFLAVNFFNDDVWGTLYNEYRLIRIGEKVYYYHDVDFVLEFTIGTGDGSNDGGNFYDFYNYRHQLEELARQKDANPDRSEELLLLFNVEGGKTVISTKTKGYGTPIKAGFQIDGGPNLLSIGSGYTEGTQQNCDPKCVEFLPKLVLTTWGNEPCGGNLPDTCGTKTYTTLDFNNFDIEIIVDWGDGSPLETFSSHDGSPLEHCYPDQGQTYQVQTYLSFYYGNAFVQLNDGNLQPNDDAQDITFSTTVACTKWEDSDPKSTLHGNYSMTSCVNNYHNLGNRVKGVNTCYKQKQNNGKWKKSKFSSISSSLWAEVYMTSCDREVDITGTKSKSNKKRLKISKRSHIFRRFNLYNCDEFITYTTTAVDKNGVTHTTLCEIKFN